VVAVGFEEGIAAVNWQVQQLLLEVTPAGIRGLEASAGATADPLWQALTTLTAWRAAELTFKANLLSGAVAEFCRRADELPDKLLLHAHAGSGIVRGHSSTALTLERAQVMLKGLADQAAAAQGNLTVPRCPVPWKPHLPVWGRPRGDLELMRKIKEQLDPRRLFNPGRFVGGI
jgi:FAD/FMN-containing dehydrogenase